MKRNGFTLIELLVVIAIIAVLAAIIVPFATSATDSAKAKKAQQEASALKLAVKSFHKDHHYMPFAATGKAVVGDDKWAQTDDSDWVEMLQGANAMKKSYFTGKLDDSGKFLDPWGNPYWVGMDRNMDGYVEGKGGPSGGSGKVIRDTVGVFSMGEDGAWGTDDDIKTDTWSR